MITRRHALAPALALALSALSPGLSSTTAKAGPLHDFERELRLVYADYRVALFRTNMDDKPASEAAIASASEKWRALSAKWGSAPPPQYAEDQDFRPLLSRVDLILDQARQEAAAGALPKAHETLEKIRDELAALRRRNGVINFSDRMNAYHEQMEKILLGAYDGFQPQGIAALREDVAILAFLLQDIVTNPPPERDARYEPALAGLRKSVEELRHALSAGDVSAIRAAIKALKPAYARMFLIYG